MRFRLRLRSISLSHLQKHVNGINLKDACMESVFTDIVGSAWVQPISVDTPSLGSTQPKLRVTPANADEVASVLKIAAQKGIAVIPIGCGSSLDIGNPPRRADIFLSTERMNAITDYEPSELTAVTGAGCTLGALNLHLEPHRQFLPWDPAGGDRRTLGGIASIGWNGPLRLGFGQPRDWILGVEFATADGNIIKSGGRVVKNVAGYDLTRLFVGSLGTLGIITSLNVKVRPQPATEISVIIRSNDRNDLWRLASATLARDVMPVALELVSASAARMAGIDFIGRADLLCVRVAGEDPDVREQALAFERLASEHGLQAPERMGIENIRALWGGLTDLPATGAPIVLRISVSPKELRETVSKTVSEFSVVMEEFSYTASPAFGTLHVMLDGVIDDARIDTLARSIESLRKSCQETGGTVTIIRAPVELKQRVDVWSPVGSSEQLMIATKRLLDPSGIMNPGRFVAGI